MPETYTFAGNATTILGLVGIISTVVIILSVFRSYWSSPFIK